MKFSLKGEAISENTFNLTMGNPINLCKCICKEWVLNAKYKHFRTYFLVVNLLPLLR